MSLDHFSSFKLRKATWADLDEIMAMEKACFANPWSRQSWTEQLQNDFVVVALTEQIMGVLTIRVVGEVGEVLRIMVADKAQRRGLGQALLEYGHAWAVSQGVVEMFLEVNANNSAAIRLYESFGYNQISRRDNYYGPGQDALVFQKQEVECLGTVLGR